MRAIVIDHFGPGLDSLVIKEMPEPEPKVGHVVIEVKAFGINHVEMRMRKGEWAKAAAGRLDVKPARIFGFDEIREAHPVMEANEAVGKMVVVRA